MGNIFTCPYCNNKYTVHKIGNYICECGVRFDYPELLSLISEHHTPVAPQYIDTSSRSVNKDVSFDINGILNTKKMSPQYDRECPLAHLSVVCGLWGFFLFGILSLPALFMGISAFIITAFSGNKYKGYMKAFTGTLIAITGCFMWGFAIFWFLQK